MKWFFPSPMYFANVRSFRFLSFFFYCILNTPTGKPTLCFSYKCDLILSNKRIGKHLLPLPGVSLDPFLSAYHVCVSFRGFVAHRIAEPQKKDNTKFCTEHSNLAQWPCNHSQMTMQPMQNCIPSLQKPLYFAIKIKYKNAKK